MESENIGYISLLAILFSWCCRLPLSHLPLYLALSLVIVPPTSFSNLSRLQETLYFPLQAELSWSRSVPALRNSHGDSQWKSQDELLSTSRPPLIYDQSYFHVRSVTFLAALQSLRPCIDLVLLIISLLSQTPILSGISHGALVLSNKQHGSLHTWSTP